MSLSALASLLSRPSEALPDPDDLTRQARALWPVTASESVQAAALALTWGFPSLTLAALPAFSDLPEVAQLRAAALLRLGRGAEVTLTPDSARAAVLQARAAWQQAGADAPRLATLARQQARAEGDAAALIAAATLHAETELHANEPRSALRSLAEGLKVAEMLGQEADAHLLALLAHAQQRVGGQTKAAQTAHKALERSLPRSPARCVALLALRETATAQDEARAGELSPLWWARWLATDVEEAQKI